MGETSDATTCVTMHRTAPRAKNHPAQNVNSADGKTPWYREMGMYTEVSPCFHTGNKPGDASRNQTPEIREDRLTLLDGAALPTNAGACAVTVVTELRLTG